MLPEGVDEKSCLCTTGKGRVWSGKEKQASDTCRVAVLITSVAQGMHYLFFPSPAAPLHILLCQLLKLQTISLVSCWFSEVGSRNPFAVHRLSTCLVFAYLSVPGQPFQIQQPALGKWMETLYILTDFKSSLSFHPPTTDGSLACCEVFVEPGFIASLKCAASLMENSSF